MADQLHNGSAGYGSLSNLIGMRRVYLVTHREGIGNDGSPTREIRTYFDEDGRMLDRVDIWKPKQ